MSRALFAKAANPKTGLSPDYANFDGTPHPNRFPQSRIFGYAAWRTASNWSVDWSWWQKAPQEQELSSKIQPFFAQQGMADYGPLYTLDGKPVTATPGVTPETHAAGLVATNAVASLAATNQPLARRFVESLWKADIPSGNNRLLRRHAVSHEPSARQRRISHLASAKRSRATISAPDVLFLRLDLPWNWTGGLERC